MVTDDSGKEFSVEARGAFDNVDDISAVPDTVYTDLRRPSPGADSRADRCLSKRSRVPWWGVSDGCGGKPCICKLALGD
jgi:hypothetical protein